MTVLRPHQKAFLEKNPDHAILAWEMRTGKTLPAVLWSNDPKRNKNAIIITPKTNRDDWKRQAPHATVYSKEEFKKHWNSIVNPTCLVIDEAHMTASPLFTKGRSQLAEAIYNFIRQNPNLHVLLLSGTPVRNDPSSFHTLLCYRGVYIPWEAWRTRFYNLESRPYLRRPAYFPKSNWRAILEPTVRKYCDIISLRDCIGYLPPESSEVIEVKTPPYKPKIDEIATWTTEHLAEQANKAQAIVGLGYRKVIIACHYIAQIDALAKELSKERPVYILDGRTKNPDQVKQDAQQADECYFIVQASMGFGFDGYMFSALVFASMSHKVIDHTQMKSRLRTLDDPHPVQYYYLLGGKWDRRIYQSIMNGEDFNIHKVK